MADDESLLLRKISKASIRVLLGGVGGAVLPWH